MAGLDKIIEQIEKEAERSAAAILEEAEKQAASIREDAEAACRSIEQEAEEEGRRRAEEYLRRSRSSAGMQKRKELLAARQDVLEEMLKKALLSLYRLEDREYFDLLFSMAERHVREEEGEILFSAEDRKRLPGDFEKRLRKLAARRGGSLKISEKTCPAERGFLLVYGGIEENCSLEAVFEEARERLKDRLQELLFPRREEGKADEK